MTARPPKIPSEPVVPTVAKPFVHLHCHTHFSLLDGANRIPELCSHVKSLGMNAVAVTDHGNLYGAIELLREAEAAGIRPIVGYEAYVAPGKRSEKDNKGSGGEYSFHLTMLAHNLKGFKNLIKLASMAYLEGFYYKPRIDKEILEAHSEGITVLSGCMSSE
ncbi:MAG TPA: PHP domain-containing protein [Gemmatales bacterium]|nr:PHP domain-containing protein [Gemmatales bacterium]